MKRYRLSISQNTVTGSLYNLHPSNDQILAYCHVPTCLMLCTAISSRLMESFWEKPTSVGT